MHKKKESGGLTISYLTNVLPQMLCQEKMEEQHIPTYFLRTSLFSSFFLHQHTQSAVLAQNGRDETGCCQGNHLELELGQG